MAQYESLFVNMMVTEELGFRLSEEDDEYLLADAFIMFLSFFGFGIIPLIVYFVGLLYSLKEQVLFFVSAGLIVLGLFSMGAVKSAFSSVSWIYAGAETLSIGVLCAGAAYGVANLIANIIDAIV
jgi:DNA damage-binding protein 1